MSEQGTGSRVTGAQSLIRALEAAGADNVFGIPGGAILPAYDPLFDSTKIRHILVRHEQGAGHAAQGYAVATGKVGAFALVSIAGAGPGSDVSVSSGSALVSAGLSAWAAQGMARVGSDKCL